MAASVIAGLLVALLSLAFETGNSFVGSPTTIYDVEAKTLRVSGEIDFIHMGSAFNVGFESPPLVYRSYFSVMVAFNGGLVTPAIYAEDAILAARMNTGTWKLSLIGFLDAWLCASVFAGGISLVIAYAIRANRPSVPSQRPNTAQNDTINDQK